MGSVGFIVNMLFQIFYNPKSKYATTFLKFYQQKKNSQSIFFKNNYIISISNSLSIPFSYQATPYFKGLHIMSVFFFSLYAVLLPRTTRLSSCISGHSLMSKNCRIISCFSPEKYRLLAVTKGHRYYSRNYIFT
jgi:hypothetical protein